MRPRERTMTTSYIGQRMKRFEDPPLVQGQGSYVDDKKLPDMLHCYFLRSPIAHARIRSIDTSEALAMGRSGSGLHIRGRGPS